MAHRFDGRRRRYVPMDVHVAFGKFGTKLLDRWGLEGIGAWMLFLAACKREPIEGTFTYTSEDEAWRKLGATPTSFTFDAFIRFTGQQKKTSKRVHGRVSYVSCTRWNEWNTPRPSPQNPRSDTRNTQRIPQESGEIVTPEVEVEVEGETKENTPTAPARLRPVDPVWDFVASIEGEPLPKRRAARGRVVSDLRLRLGDESPAELQRRHEALAREWGDAKATARALAEHWDRAGRMADGLMRPPAAKPRTDGRVSVDELYTSALPPMEGGLELEAG